MPQSTEEILSFAFSQCKEITKVTLPDNLKFIPYGLFSECTNLKKLTIPASITRIESYAFANSGYSEENEEYTMSYSIEEIDFKGNQEQWEALTSNVYEEWINTANINILNNAFTLGDVNDDGQVTSEDALNVLQAIVGETELTEKQKKSADIDNNNEIDSADALAILQMVVGIEK